MTYYKVMRLLCGNPVVMSFIEGNQLISDTDHVDWMIAQNFKEVFRHEEHDIDTDDDLLCELASR